MKFIVKKTEYMKKTCISIGVACFVLLLTGASGSSGSGTAEKLHEEVSGTADRLDVLERKLDNLERQLDGLSDRLDGYGRDIMDKLRDVESAVKDLR
jgi:NADP-dependent 3-hydroxy acid dehydrogenase YdfG